MGEYSNFKKEIKKYKTIAICSNDAGGAEVLSSMIQRVKKKYFFILSGPAIKIFKKKIKNIKINSISKVINKSEILITSTSLKSNMENKAIKFFQKKNKISISVLDHWTRYKQRFIYKNEFIKPDFIWCLDIDSFKIAKKNFYPPKIKILKNYYFESIKDFKKKNKKINKNGLIFVSDNYDDFYLTKGKDIYLFKKLFKYINSRNIKIKKIGFKKHPSESEAKYKILTKKYSQIIYEKSSDLFKILSKYKIIAGHQSMALVVGKLLGLKTINIKLTAKEKNFIPKKYLDVSI